MFIKRKEFEVTHSLISMKKIGVIGLGNMGSAVAKNILRANFPLTIYDIRKEAGDKLIAAGAVWKNSPKELLNEVDIVVSMVFGPKEIEAVMKNEDGILKGNCNQKGWIEDMIQSIEQWRTERPVDKIYDVGIKNPEVKIEKAQVNEKALNKLADDAIKDLKKMKENI